MARRIQSEQELLDLINHKPSKRKKIAIAVLVIAMILAMIIVIVVQIHKSNKFKEEVLEAKTALANAEYSDAVKKFDIVIKKDDDNAEFYEGRGDSYAGMKKYQDAMTDYHKAIDLDGSNKDLYKKGVKAGVKAGDNKAAISFIDEMKKNVSENEGEELRKETFVYPAQKALKRKLNQLKKQASGNKDAYTVVLEAYTYFDIDGDGIDELLTESGWSVSKQKTLNIYAYRRGNVKTMLDRTEYGFMTLKVYDKTASMELYMSGNGSEEYRYYRIKKNACVKTASRQRRSTAAGAYSDGQWTYYGAGEYDGIGKSEFNKRVSRMKKGKARKSSRSSWKAN